MAIDVDRCSKPRVASPHRIVKLVRAIRKGWIKTGKAKRAQQQQPQVYLLWGDDDQADTDKTGSRLTYIPPAKPKLPGHEESYNPPKEYVPTGAPSINRLQH
eukprot:GHRQ01038944.1.p1 GENE.GHRQ01038944.1~~GHRQ01038944.1.p1  ORF type:complete len:116 (+),score=45.11 GHRQ01038944.1:43-348(+)